MEMISLDSREHSLHSLSQAKGTNSGSVKQFLKTHRAVVQMIGFLFIAIVSMHDAYLVTIEEEILTMEKNPLCVKLIQWDPDGFTFFLAGKMTGTLLVILSLYLLPHLGYHHADLVTAAIVGFQFSLLVYLHLSDPMLGGLPNFSVLFYG